MSNPPYSQKVIDELVVEEYNYVREMIKTNIEIMEKNETYILIAVAGFYAFALREFKNDVNLYKFSFLIPIILSVLGFFRYKALDIIIGRHNDYIEEIEKRASNYIDWTGFYRRKSTDYDGKYLKRTRTRFWFVLIIGTIIVFCLFNAKILICLLSAMEVHL